MLWCSPEDLTSSKSVSKSAPAGCLRRTPHRKRVPFFKLGSNAPGGCLRQTPHQKTHPGKKSPICVFLLFFGNKKDARRPYDHLGGVIAPRSLLCVRKQRFPFLKKDIILSVIWSVICPRNLLPRSGPESAPPTPLPHAPGVRMTWVYK